MKRFLMQPEVIDMFSQCRNTYWDIDSNIDEKEFVEGEKVVVLKTHKNTATIEKKQN